MGARGGEVREGWGRAAVREGVGRGEEGRSVADEASSATRSAATARGSTAVEALEPDRAAATPD